jgi:hypothetical protein
MEHKLPEVGDEEALRLCRMNVESLCNLQFLMRQNLDNPESLRIYLDVLELHLEFLTNILSS